MGSEEKAQLIKRALLYVDQLLERKDREQSGRYRKLPQEGKYIVAKGIIGRLRKCNRGVLLEPQDMTTLIDHDTIREIIDDAAKGHAVYEQVNNDTASGFESGKSKRHRYNT